MLPSGNQALPLFIVGFLYVIGIIFSDFSKKILKKCHLLHEPKDFDVDEGLGTYFECLSLWHRKSWIANELHSVDKLGISTMG